MELIKTKSENKLTAQRGGKREILNRDQLQSYLIGRAGRFSRTLQQDASAVSWTNHRAYCSKANPIPNFVTHSWANCPVFVFFTFLRTTKRPAPM